MWKFSGKAPGRDYCSKPELCMCIGVAQMCLLSLQVSKKDWMESVQLVFDYFCERTPRYSTAVLAPGLDTQTPRP